MSYIFIVLRPHQNKLVCLYDSEHWIKQTLISSQFQVGQNTFVLVETRLIHGKQV